MSPLGGAVCNSAGYASSPPDTDMPHKDNYKQLRSTFVADYSHKTIYSIVSGTVFEVRSPQSFFGDALSVRASDHFLSC